MPLRFRWYPWPGSDLTSPLKKLRFSSQWRQLGNIIENGQEAKTGTAIKHDAGVDKWIGVCASMPEHRNPGLRARPSLAVRLGGVLLIAAGGIWAGPVSIDIINNSFESPYCLPAGQSLALHVVCAPTGWSAPGGTNGEAFLPDNMWTSVPDGAQVGYSNGPGDTLTQVLTTDIAVNTTYTLSVWVSARVGGVFEPEIELLAGNTLTSLITLNDANPGGNQAPTLIDDHGLEQYSWVNWTGSYTSAGSGVLIGQPLEIVLGADAIQVDFDNITLTSGDPPVPEPAMFTLMGVALLGLAMRRRCVK